MYHQHSNLTHNDVIQVFTSAGLAWTDSIINEIIAYANWLGRQKIRRVEKSRQLAAKIGNILPSSNECVSVSCTIAKRFHDLNRNGKGSRSS